MYKYVRDEEEYKRTIDENEYVFVIYSATWCGPCKAFKAWLEEEYVEFPHPILIVDVEELEELASDISAMPTMVGFHNQEEFVRTEGFNKQKLKELLDATITTTNPPEPDQK